MNSKMPFTALSPVAKKLSAAESTLKYENIPGRNEWREHAETIKKFWIHPDAVIKKAFIRCISCIKLIEVNVEPKNL